MARRMGTSRAHLDRLLDPENDKVQLDTVERAVAFIDKSILPELTKLPRWTFARALMVEALKTGKSRDLNTAVRQFRQALGNEKWLDDQEEPRAQEAE